MNTSKYDPQHRRDLKLDQRTDAYRDLQRRTAEQRSQLESKLRDCRATIDRLKKRLLESGVSPDEVTKLAA